MRPKSDLNVEKLKTLFKKNPLIYTFPSPEIKRELTNYILQMLLKQEFCTEGYI